MIAAVDIGGTKIAVGLVDGNGHIVARRESPTDAGRGFNNALERICSALRSAAQNAGTEVTGIGIACTGPVDPFAGIIGNVDFLPGWKGFNLVEPLAKEFKVSVAMENDADAAALGEAAWGAGRGKHRFIYLTVSTGIGGGIVLDGKLYRGVEQSHPEIGHHVIDPAGPKCFCGARGCWEALASGPAMVEWVRAHAPSNYKHLPRLDARRIFELMEQGEGVCRLAVEREAYYLGLGLANLITLFTPDVIALGGGVMKSAHLFLEQAKQIIRQNCGLVPHEKTEVRLASLGADTALSGAAQVWCHRFR